MAMGEQDRDIAPPDRARVEGGDGWGSAVLR